MILKTADVEAIVHVVYGRDDEGQDKDRKVCQWSLEKSR